MERINKILNNEAFLYHLSENNQAEANRHFCRHNLGHFLDVARIAWIMNLEEGLGIQREWIYAAALLHDIGRHIQYEEGTPHEEASALIAPSILENCGFSCEEISAVTEAILSHGNRRVMEENSFRGILYRGDKASRTCFACEAQKECDWKAEKKNWSIRY